MNGFVVSSASGVGFTSLKARAQSYGRFLLRWGWFVVFSMMLTTTCSFFIPDLTTLDSYQASYQVQVTSAGTGTSPNAAQATSFFAGLLQSPGVLNLAISKLHAYQKFKDLQLSDLQEGLVTASVVKGSNFVLLSAYSDSPQNASLIVMTVYQTMMDKIRTDRNSVIDGIKANLNKELKAVVADVANTLATLQQLQATKQTDTHQYRDLSNFYAVQRDRVKTIIAAQASLQLQGYDGLVRVINNSPVVTTVPGGGVTHSDRLMLSPLVGLMMGLGGALVASRFSRRLRLHGEKCELILPHIATTVPTLPQLKEDCLLVLAQSAASHCVPLLRRLQYQASEYEQRIQLITVTSPRQQEGKSTIATSIAITAAQSGYHTLLVDANPRRPVIDQYFQLPKSPGTLDTIQALAIGSISSSLILETSIPKLSVLPIGVLAQEGESSPLYEPLRIDGLRALSSLLCAQAEIIIFDGPSLLHDTNLTNLAALSDAVILVVDAQKSDSDSVLEAEAQLIEMGVFFAVLLNRTTADLVQ